MRVESPEPSGPNSLRSFLDDLLAEQGRLDTPVARFSRAHDTASISQLSTLNSQLIPLTAPAPGEQYAFEVDLDACSGCKACVAGCHSLNGLDGHETWRDVGLVLGGDASHPFQQTITSACHHCADPACANGCPVLAYEKDSLTGIVRHLDDQCIGCSYCILKCPYDVPKFSSRLGIVRKCDMCHGRLAAGEAPACVQACPTHAIKIVTVKTSSAALQPALEATAEQHGTTTENISSFPAVFPDPAYTRPTTRYISKRAFPANARPADIEKLRPQPAHWPLVYMLVLTQLSVGALAAALVVPRLFVTHYVTNRLVAFEMMRAAEGSASAPDAIVAEAIATLRWVALLAAVGGIGASVAHLGQPRRAWRVFLNLRKSWLSREAVGFAAYLVLLAWSVGAGAFAREDASTTTALDLATLGCGLLGIFCSVMIYADTRRALWSLPRSSARFFGTTIVLSLAAAVCVDPRIAPVLTAATLLKLAAAAWFLRHRHGCDSTAPDSQSARLLVGRMFRWTKLHFFLGVLGGVLLPIAALLDAPSASGLSVVAFVALCGAEIAERALFFRAVVAPKMPGVHAS